MTHLHFPVITRPKWLKVTINRSRIKKFIYEAYLGIQPDGSDPDKFPDKDHRSGAGDRL